MANTLEIAPQRVASGERSARLRTSWLIVPALVLGWASFVAVGQVDRLLGDVVGANRAVYSLSEVIGFTPWVASSAWETWSSAGAEDARAFAAMHSGWDLVFIICYVFLLQRLITRCAGGATKNVRHVYRGLVWAIAGFDVLENVAIFYIAAEMAPDVPGDLGWAVIAQAMFTGLKWAATITFAAFVLFGDALGVTVRAFVKRLVAGLYAQRLGLILVVGFAYLALSGNGDLAEQIPDVYRGWFDAIGTTNPLDNGLGHAIWAAIAGTVVLGGLVYFGRQRGRRYVLGEPPVKPPALLRAWWIAASVLFILGLTALIWAGVVALPAIVGLLAVLVTVPFLSRLIRRRFKRITTLEPILRRDVRALAPAAFWAGDAIAVTWIAAGLLGPFAAMVPVISLTPLGQFEGTRLEDHMGSVTFFTFAALIIAMGAATLAWWALQRRFAVCAKPIAADAASPPEQIPAGASSAGDRTVDVPTPRHRRRRTADAARSAPPAATFFDEALSRTRPETAKPRSLQLLEIGSLLACLATVVTFALLPAQAGPIAGPLAVVVLLIGAWTGIAGGVVLLLGERRPPELFTVLRLRSTPVVAIGIALPIVVGSMFPTADPHAIRLQENLELPHDRPTIRKALGEWSKTACALDGPGNVHVQPLIVIAAEGGGIRAATWTVDILRELFEPDSDCAANAVFASAGASGGSVGLAMFATSTTTDKHKVTVAEASRPDALGTDMAAMLSGEAITAVTGIRLPILGAAADRTDRAALQELEWEQDGAHQLEQPFASGWNPGTGFVVFNSTDSVSNCKVVISQLKLSSYTTGSSQCAGPDAALTHSVDLISHRGTDCRAGMSWATASFLSARFPFVSPSGRLTGGKIPAGCAASWDMQLLDGGLLDNSALGTVSDMMPELLGSVRDRNSAAASGTPNHPLIVPLVLFVSNGPGSDVLGASGRARPEWVAPIATLISAKGAQLEPAAWLSRLSDQLQGRAVCERSDWKCWVALNAVHRQVAHGVAVASQATEPSTSVPLGWTLSWFSRSRLGDAAEEQGDCIDPSPDESVPCRASGTTQPWAP